MLLTLIFIGYRIGIKAKINPLEFTALLLLLLIIPFVRGDAVLIYGFIFFLGVYHFWKHNHLQSSLLIIASLFVLAIGIHFTLGIREHYLIKWQFSRILPRTNEQILSIIFYTSPS